MSRGGPRVSKFSASIQMNEFDRPASNERPYKKHRTSKHPIGPSQTANPTATDGGKTMFKRFLIPFELPEAEPIPPALAEWFDGSYVVALGHYAVPLQTPPEQIRQQAESDARTELTERCEQLERHGATVETQLVFGGERTETIDRVAREESCGVEVAIAPVDEISRILVPLRNMDQIHAFAGIFSQTEARVTLFHVAEDGMSQASVESELETARSQLDKACAATVTTAVGTGRHRKAIVETAELYDLVIMGETDTGLATQIFGSLPDRIVKRAETPVFVVQSG